MNTIIKRKQFLNQIDLAFSVNPVVAILGPRQCGKTTLANLYRRERLKDQEIDYFDLEKPEDLGALDSPQISLSQHAHFTIIDEIQRLPNLFTSLRVLVDEHQKQRKFLILGSASRDLIKQSSETLAGRISYLELTPFNFQEVDHLQTLWLRGGFPNSYLANNDVISHEWRKAYISTFLEKDIPNLGINIPPRTLRRFWMMLTHYHGQIFNASEIGMSLGVAHTTVRHYLDILTGTFMIRELSPWVENIDKRQIKSPKIYFRDSGILHSLLGVQDQKELLHHPKLGASWEGLVLEEIIRKHHASNEECYFWGVHNQAELDLLIIKDGKRLGFEIKYMDAPKLTPSMKTALELLKLDQLNVVYPGKKEYQIADRIRVVSFENYLEA